MTDIAVVGSSGFIGRWLVHEAEAIGWQAHCYDLDTPVIGREGLPPEISSVQAIYWLASRTNPYLAAMRPELVEQELQEFRTFLDLVRAAGIRPHIVFPSSGGTVYDSTATPPYTESSPVRPANAYAALKLRLETELVNSGLPSVRVRIANPYGPGQQSGRGQGVVAEWVAALAEGRPIPVMGSLQTKRDFVYVRDVARGLIAIVQAGVEGVVNLGSGRGTSLAEVLSILTELSTAAVGVDRLPARAIDAPSNWLAIEHLMQSTGWRPETDLVSGLRMTLDEACTRSRRPRC